MASELTSDPRVARLGVALRLGRTGDERLARLVADGDERAFAVLYRRYHQPLYRYCRSIVHNDADAQDALQSTFANALAALRRGHRDAPLRPWLFRIAHNETISLLRRRRPTAELSESEPASSGSPQEQIEQRMRLEELVADLRALPERQRSALVMRELSGLSHEEIAIATGMTSGGAKQAIFDARQALADFAEGRAMACEDVRRRLSDGDRRLLRGRRMRAHLRDCSGCATFAAAISARGQGLSALAPPIAPAAAAGLLASVAGSGTAAHGGAGGAVGLITAGTGKTLATGAVVKALAGVAVVAVATAGATGTLRQLVPGAGHARPRQGTSQPASHSPAGARAGAQAGTAHLRAPGLGSAPGVSAAHPHEGLPGAASGALARGHGAAARGRTHASHAGGRSGTAREKHASPRRGAAARGNPRTSGAKRSNAPLRAKTSPRKSGEPQTGTREGARGAAPTTTVGAEAAQGAGAPFVPGSTAEKSVFHAQGPVR
jgi:RNA polymerase sigma factor (sigma-70 family)